MLNSPTDFYGNMGSVDLGPTPTGDYNGNHTSMPPTTPCGAIPLGSTSDLRANGDNTGSSAGVIDTADYIVWKQNFGVAGAGSLERTTVPEPSTAALARHRMRSGVGGISAMNLPPKDAS